MSITETPVERWRFQTVIALGATTFPERPSDWEVWSSSSEGLIKNSSAYEFQFTGVKNGVSYRQFIQWYMWGDALVELRADVPEFDWAASTTVRSSLQSVMDSFVPHDETHLLTADDVLSVMFDQLDERPSGIRARNEVLGFGYEMTCREIYDNLLTAPEYLGFGLWQLSAQTLTGTETWWVFEPTGSIMTLNSNLSRC